MLCLLALTTFSSADAEHKAGVQAVSDGEAADKDALTCRRDAAHTGVSAVTHGLSEHQTSREIDWRDTLYVWVHHLPRGRSDLMLLRPPRLHRDVYNRG